MTNPGNLPFTEIDVEAFNLKLQENSGTLQLIDVREPHEIAIASLPGFKAYPLSQYSTWGEQILDQLDPNGETYVLCHHGMRSAQMCGWLSQQGFTSVINISGGIDAFSQLVDAQIPRY